MVIGKTIEMNEANLAQHFTNNSLIQFLYQKTFWWKQFYLMFFIYIGAMQMFDLYITYAFIGAKVNHTSLKNAG